MTREELCAAIDSTNLRLDATEGDVVRLCEEAALHGFYSVMVYPSSVALCRRLLAGSQVKIGTVVGFPSGRFSTAAKAEEIRQAAGNGSDEVDIVMDYAALMAGHRRPVQAELVELVSVAHRRGQLCKVIAETCFLDDIRLLEALELCEAAQADFIKTSTGFGTKGASVHHVQVWRNARRGGIRIKAAGGVKTLGDARALLAAGAERLGTSSAAALVAELTGGGPVAGGGGAY